ncbi:MAG: hypothetical protein EBT79_05040 [Actinobacteria bacterium]|nr:hypothetical protein [Actinomycetota bacterium]NBR66638.1 hypothetical protein [Actinomycetota bacterium]
MSRTLTAADRSALIRIASTMPVGSTERRAILAGLSQASTRVAALDVDDIARILRNEFSIRATEASKSAKVLQYILSRFPDADAATFKREIEALPAERFGRVDRSPTTQDLLLFGYLKLPDLLATQSPLSKVASALSDELKALGFFVRSPQLGGAGMQRSLVGTLELKNDLYAGVEVQFGLSHLLGGSILRPEGWFWVSDHAGKIDRASMSRLTEPLRGWATGRHAPEWDDFKAHDTAALNRLIAHIRILTAEVKAEAIPLAAQVAAL